MIKLPISAQFSALALTAAILALVHPLNTFASSSDDADHSNFCEKILAHIPAAVASNIEGFPLRLGDTASLQDINLNSRAEKSDSAVLIRKGKIITVPTRTRLDALLILHRAIFSPALVHAQINNIPQALAFLEREDMEGYSKSESLNAYTIDPEMPNVSDIAAVSVRADNAFTIKLRVGQQLHTLPLKSELDSLILLAARKLKLGMSLERNNDKKFDVHSFVIHGHSSYRALPADFTLKASEIVSLFTPRLAAGETAKDETLKIKILDPVESYNSVGQAIYLTLESASLEDSHKILEALLEQKEVRLKIETVTDLDGVTTNRFSMPEL